MTPQTQTKGSSGHSGQTSKFGNVPSTLIERIGVTMPQTAQQKRDTLISKDSKSFTPISTIVAALFVQFQEYCRLGLPAKAQISYEELESAFTAAITRFVTKPIQVAEGNFVAILTVEPSLLTIPQTLSFLNGNESQQMDMSYSNIRRIDESTYGSGLFRVVFDVNPTSKIGNVQINDRASATIEQGHCGLSTIGEAVGFVIASRIAFGESLKEIGGTEQVLVLTGATWGPTGSNTPTVDCEGNLDFVPTQETTTPSYLAPNWANSSPSY
jgi:hypothetical protein